MNRPPLLPQPLYQGSVNTWECDEGGHLNVRFQLERAFAGLAHMARALELPHAFTAQAGSTLIAQELHVRFLKEARPGAPLSMHGGVIDLGESAAAFCLDMRHGDGAPATHFMFKAVHAEARSLRAFPWSSRTRAAAERLRCAQPEHGKPRSVDLTKAPADVSRERAVALNMARIGGALVQPEHCDAFGRMRGDHMFGRVSDSVPNLLARWRQEAAANSGVQPAGAVVEARLVLRRWPRAGELIEVFSGVAGIEGKTMRLVHWIVDPEAGAAWASLEVVALTFDVATRKAIEPSPEARAAIQQRAIAGLSA
jgi:acyl-CoA thioester hydrolase